MVTHEQHNDTVRGMDREITGAWSLFRHKMFGEPDLPTDSLAEAIDWLIDKLNEANDSANYAQRQLAKYADNPNNIVRIEGYDGPLVPEHAIPTATRVGYERAMRDVAEEMEDAEDRPRRWHYLYGFVQGRRATILDCNGKSEAST